MASGPHPTPKSKTPRFSYIRIIALLVRGSRKLVIEQLPTKEQTYRLKGKRKTMSGGTVYFNKKRWVPPGSPALSIPEGKAFLKKFFKKGGILSTDSASTYDILVNKKKLFGTEHVAVGAPGSGRVQRLHCARVQRLNCTHTVPFGKNLPNRAMLVPM